MNQRDYERMERRRRTRKKSMVSTIIIVTTVVALVVALIIVVVALVANSNKNNQQEETTVALTNAVATTAAQTTAPETTARATFSETHQPAPQPTAAYGYSSTEYSQDPYNTPTTYQPAGNDTPAGGSGGGTELHYTAGGQTSGGCNWTYSGGVGVNINCNYNYQTHVYDFVITGTSPGTTSFTLIYYVDDNTPVNVPMTVQVDSDLNVTQIG